MSLDRLEMAYVSDTRQTELPTKGQRLLFPLVQARLTKLLLYRLS